MSLRNLLTVYSQNMYIRYCPPGSSRWLRIRKAGLHPYLLAGLATAAVAIYLTSFGTRYGLDLNVYRDAVMSWESGRNPYLFTFTQSSLYFTYPPPALIALSPLAWAPFKFTIGILWATDIVTAAGAVVMVLRSSGNQLTRNLWFLAIAYSCASVLILEPVRSDVDYGQIELILMFLVVTDLILIPQRYRGVLLGVVAAVWLTPLVFILYFLFMRDFRSVARASVSFCTCVLLAWVFWPSDSRNYWFHDIRASRVGGVAYAGNQSWFAVLNRTPFFGSATVAAWLLLSLATVATGGFVAWRCIKSNQTVLAMLSVALTGLLVSPISWTHHWVWMLLIPPAFFGSPREYCPTSVKRLLCVTVALTCVAPYWWLQRGSVADLLEALLPICAGAALAVWASAEWRYWRGGRRPISASQPADGLGRQDFDLTETAVRELAKQTQRDTGTRHEGD
jgi:alpha-1,2-mannosyltransferase